MSAGPVVYTRTVSAMTTLLPTELFPIDDDERLFISPAISDWSMVHDRGIEVIIDLEGDLDYGVSTRPGHLLYVYHHIYDEHLPDLPRMQALAMHGRAPDPQRPARAVALRHGVQPVGAAGRHDPDGAGHVDGPTAVERLRERASGRALQRAVRRVPRHAQGA